MARSSKGQGRFTRVTVFCLVLAGLLLLRWAFLEQIDALAFDLALRTGGGGAPDPRIVIVAIDDGSLRALGPWPWRTQIKRRLFDRILEQDPAVLAIDILLESLHPYPVLQDRRVVVATALGLGREGNPSELFWQDPQQSSQGGPPLLGHIHADKDLDGVCRSIPFAVQWGGARRWAFAIQVARVYWGCQREGIALSGDVLLVGDHRIPRLQRPLDAGLDSAGILPSLQGDRLLINSRGGVQTFPYLSAARVLEGGTPSLEDKIVLLGATSYSLGDHLATAFSQSSEMPGIEIHANALDTILNRRFLSTPREAVVLGLILITALMVWIPFGSGFRNAGWALFGALLAGALLIPFLLLWSFSLWLPAATLVSTVAITGVSAQLSRSRTLSRRLDEQFRRLAALLPEPGRLPGLDHPLPDSRRGPEWKIHLLGEATRNALETARLREEMVAFASHELKTPLVSVRGLAELLADQTLGPQERRQALELIQQETTRLASMVEDYLMLVRVAHQKLLMQPCFLKRILDQARQSVQPELERKQQSLRFPDLLSDTRISAHSSLLSQVFVNLLANASRYSPPDSCIVLSEKRNRDHVEVTVSDQGCGIPESEIPRIFDRFFRGSSSRQTGMPGSGLGLAFVKDLVERHGGSITVRSRPGEGSTFVVRLPLLQPERRASDPS